jgi:hypothetical protein
MGRFGFFGAIGATFALWYERIISGEWLLVMLRYGFDGGWWLIKGACQIVAAAFVLIVTGNGSAPHVPNVGSDQTLTVTQPLADSFRVGLQRAPWAQNDTHPAIWTVLGDKYWVVIRGSLDRDSHADARGAPVERQCLHLYAAPAVQDAGQYIAPQPYLVADMMIKWPEVVTECRMSGQSTFQFPALQS